MVINLIYKKIYLNIIILYTLAYIFKRRINLKCIFLCFSNILYPLSFFIIFKSISIKLIIHFILIIILLKGINFNIFLSSIILYLYALNFRNYVNVKIVFNNKIIKLKGLIDTGNMLTYKNYNIIILNKKYLKENLEILYVTSVRFLARYDGEVSEPLVGRQGSRVSMRMARGRLGVVLERRPQCAVSHEVRRRGQ